MPATAANLTPAQLPADAQAATAKVMQLLAALRSAFHEREVEALLLVLAYLAEEHVLLLGPHGTGKTALATAFAQALGVPADAVWTYLFGKFTMPDEVFGPPDLPSLKAGTMRRNTTRKLPQAQVAVGDEIFKANRSILNALLTLLNERTYDNPDRQACPLQLFVGLSNELPEDGPTGPLGPLYDRFLFRRWTSYIADQGKLVQLLADPAPAPSVAVRLTQADTQALRAAVRQVRLDGPTGQVDDQGQQLSLVEVVVCKLKAGLERDGLVVSDRRWRKAMKAVQAHAVLHGRMVATLADLAPLAHCLWDEPSDADKVAQAVLQLADADGAKARRMLAACVQLMQELPGPDADISEFAAKGAQASSKIRRMVEQLQALTPSASVQSCIDKAQGMADQIDQ
jgi:MoxR-like ATPase